MPRSYPALALLLSLLALSAAACGPVDSAAYAQGWGTATPTPVDLEGTATVQAAAIQAAILGTQAVKTDVAFEATEAEGVRQGTSAAVIAQLDAERADRHDKLFVQLTSDASALQLTQAARSIAATDTAYPATATGQAAGTATAGPPTATAEAHLAILRNIEIEDAKESALRAGMWKDALLFIQCGGAVLVLGAGYTFVYLLYLLIERKFRVVDTHKGPVQWKNGSYEIVPLYNEPGNAVDVSGPRVKTNGWPSLTQASAAPQAEWLSPSVLASPMPPRNGSGKDNAFHWQAVELLRAARDVVGDNATKLPRWTDVEGATSEKWQAMTKAAGVEKGKGLLVAVPSVGTYVRHGNLGMVLYQLETGQVFLEPAE